MSLIILPLSRSGNVEAEIWLCGVKLHSPSMEACDHGCVHMALTHLQISWLRGDDVLLANGSRLKRRRFSGLSALFTLSEARVICSRMW